MYPEPQPWSESQVLSSDVDRRGDLDGLAQLLDNQHSGREDRSITTLELSTQPPVFLVDSTLSEFEFLNTVSLMNSGQPAQCQGTKFG